MRRTMFACLALGFIAGCGWGGPVQVGDVTVCNNNNINVVIDTDGGGCCDDDDGAPIVPITVGNVNVGNNNTINVFAGDNDDD